MIELLLLLLQDMYMMMRCGITGMSNHVLIQEPLCMIITDFLRVDVHFLNVYRITRR